METRIFLTIAILAFNLNISFAEYAPEISLNRPVSNAQINLATASSAVTDFSDLVPEPAPLVISLIPVTPKEADFDDESEEQSSNNFLNNLSPSTPKEADFEDNITPYTDTLPLIPITPKEAVLEETI